MKVLVAPAHLFLNKSYGGEVAWAYNIISRLAEDFGFRIDAVCGTADNLSLSNVRVLETGFSKGDLLSRGMFYLRCYNVAKRLYKGVDLVHHMFPFGFKAGFNPLAVLRHLRGKPFIIGPIQYPQEYSDVIDYEWVSGRMGLKARVMYNLEYTTIRFFQKPMKMLHEATLREAEALVFDSEKTLRLYKRQYGDVLSGKFLSVIPPGVEKDFFVKPVLAEKDGFEILTVGYLLKRKGIEYLIRAMVPVVKEFKNVKLKVVGNGPYKENLIRLTKELSLSEYVEFSGRVPRRELPKVYANCDVYVQPALSETFPSAIREAMAAGRPVVTTDVGMIGEYVKDGVNGCLVPPKSSEALARRIIDLLEDEDWRVKIGEEARKYAEDNFSWDKLAEAWYKTYGRLVE
jgi:glycosyltransferase involved in cell wall biosynthesis